MKDVLTKCMKMTEKKTMIVLVNVSSYNEMSKEEAKNLMRM